jgi:hypothetical protein
MNRLVSALLALLIALAGALPAQAGELGWCEADPLLRLGGNEVRVLVAIPERYLPLVIGPTVVTVGTRAGVTREVLATDAGFAGHGEVVVWRDLEAPLLASLLVTVPIDAAQLAPEEAVPVRVTVRAGGRELQIFGTHAAPPRLALGRHD